MVTGYLHSGYAESLGEFGVPLELPRCKGWILERQISGFSYQDAMGCYPLFSCQDWSQLQADLENLGDRLVSLSLVTDPFGEYDEAYLQKCFKDTVIPFKQHFTVDLSKPIDTIVSKSHRSTVRRAMQKVEVEWCPDPTLFLAEWIELFEVLRERHNITGIRAFSRTAFAKHLSLPGMVMFRAVSQGITVGLDLWYVQKDVAYGHLVAISPLGYRLRASYALKWYLLHYFVDKVRWLDLGGVSGANNHATKGLNDFKMGWSTGTQTVYLCGRIFDSKRYGEIVKAKGITATSYFPAYRVGEFG
jgi:Acetyltransferase (GNAT) domain